MEHSGGEDLLVDNGKEAKNDGPNAEARDAPVKCGGNPEGASNCTDGGSGVEKETEEILPSNDMTLKGEVEKMRRLEAKQSTFIGENDSAVEYEQFKIGDNWEIASEFTQDKFLHTHPEGSFMAFLSDKSEENVEQLIESNSRVGLALVHCGFQLDTILPEIREKIWKMLPFADIPSVRATCKIFQGEIDSEIGIQLYLIDNEEESFRLAITTAIQRLVIVHMEMSSLCKMIPHNPHKLKELKIQGCVSRDAVHEILLRCSNVEILEIEHSSEWVENYSLEAESEDSNVWGSLKDWILGNLFKPEAEIKYFYGCFKKLRKIKFYSSDNPSPRTKNLLRNGLLPILNCTNSHNLTSIDIKIFVTFEESKLLTDSLFEIFLRSRNLKEVRVKHCRSDSYTFEPLPNVDYERKISHSALTVDTSFSEHRPVPQFHCLDLEMPEFLRCYFDWVFLLKHQRKLRRLTWDVGGNYWLYPVQGIQQSAKTLESLILRMIRCNPSGEVSPNDTLEPEPLSMGHFHELIALKHFHIISMELNTSQICRIDMLPKKIENLQIECFQITPEQLLVIHNTLPSLKFLSLNHWNDSRENFVASLKVIGQIIEGHNGKYRALHFLEKSMYSAVEELLEMNELLMQIKNISETNAMVVDEVSGDNGIGFALVVGDDNQFASKRI